MSYTVFFKEANQIFPADNFINDQPITHQELLKSIADELAQRGTVNHPQATRNSKEWSILLNDNGGIYVYTLFISKLEKEESNNEIKIETPQKKRTLVIVDPSGPRDTVGGYHPGYWLTDDYVNFLQDNHRALFMQTVHQIVHNIPSKNYTKNSDGSVSIYIETPTILLTSRAEWI